jgi:hypothetical protein
MIVLMEKNVVIQKGKININSERKENNQKKFFFRSSLTITIDDDNEYAPVFTHKNYLFKLHQDETCSSCRVSQEKKFDSNQDIISNNRLKQLMMIVLTSIIVSAVIKLQHLTFHFLLIRTA